MGQIRDGAFYTEGGRPMSYLIRESFQVPPQPVARLERSSARLTRGPATGGGDPRGSLGLVRRREVERMARFSVRESSTLRPRMISFLHEEGSRRHRGYFIRDISDRALHVTRVRLDNVGGPGPVSMSAESQVRSWGAYEASLQESFELLGQLGRWRVPLTIVAVSAAAALLLGFGPAATVTGLGVSEIGGAAVSLTTRMLMDAIASALGTFIQQNYAAMEREARTETGAARFWESRRYSFTDVLRQALISGVGSGITSGIIRTPDGSRGFEAFLAHVVGRVGNAFAGVLQNLFEIATRDPGRMPTEEQIRAEVLQSLRRDLSMRIIN